MPMLSYRLTRILLLALLVFAAQTLAAPPRAAVLDDALPNTDPATARELADALRQAGYEVASLSAAAIIDEKTLTPERFDLLLIPNARVAPLSAIPVLRRFLDQGGNLIACGLPAFDSLVVNVNGKWLTRADRQAILRATRPQHVLADFAKENISTWKHSADRPATGTQFALVATPTGKVLHVVVPRVTGWDTLLKDFPGAFTDGHTLTCFRAKGGEPTRQLLVEWTEKDGSRWIATVELTTDWQDFALPPEAFVAWQPPRGRGGPNDHLRPENAQRLSIGLAVSHASLPPGQHEYWFDSLGTAANPLAGVPRSIDVPHLEGLSPSYLFFPITSADFITSPIGPYPERKAPIRLPSDLLGLHPRPGRIGFNKDRPYHFQPLLSAYEDADFRGTIAALIIPLRKPAAAGALAVFTPTDPAFYQQRPIQGMITFAARTIRRGVFLAEGGSAFYTILANRPIPVGARVLRTSSDDPGQISVRITLTPSNSNKPTYSKTFPVQVTKGALAQVSDTFTTPTFPVVGYSVTTEIFADNQVLDSLDHELHVWRPKTNPQFIQARDGGFFLDNKPWKAHGVNYMPSSGIAQPIYPMFEHWTDAPAYDPDIIDRDLRRIKAMNLNSVSVFLGHNTLPAMNLLDFLRQCQSLGLHVNLSLRPGTPLDFPWPKIKEMIETLRLKDNDVVFAYDLAWEPSHYTHQHQKNYIPAWKDWLLKKYGSIDSAAKSWEFPAPTESSQLSIPPTDHLLNDGPWRKLVADYRAFLDDMLRPKYAEARRLIKSIDPNHAVSFRMQLSGDPTIADPNTLPYDFFGLADAVDIWEPEAYGRIGDWDRVKPGHFTAAYARLCDPNKPVLWAEMGYTVWDQSSMAAHPDKLAFQARYFADFYKMMISSGADGIFYWWYPAGYRFNEKSDYGIINPDGTDRPVTQIIRDNAAAFLAAPKPVKPTHFIPVNRDRDARGLFGIYQAVQKEYWQAIDNGQAPGLRWEKQPGR
ncbi:MAG: beta-galactosidase [Planctomycetota bacterium]|nr:beta-galactosidase [Planctomycetota bacterium]